MRRKVLFGFDYTDSEFIKLVLYLFVGGTAALFEWGLFYVFIHEIQGNQKDGNTSAIYKW